jgi:TRAP-type uncharacterized transport system substrate-binding protein
MSKAGANNQSDRVDLKRALWLALPATLLCLIAFGVAYQFVEPAPPREFAIANGRPDGAYHLFARQYSEILAREEVTLKVLSTAGSVENLSLLESGSEGVQVALVQGGIPAPADGGGLESLGSLYYEPLWVFSRQPNVARLSDLRSGRLAVGELGSGSRTLASSLLEDNGVDGDNSQLLEFAGNAAADALLAAQVDAAFFVAAPQAPVIEMLLRSDEVQLMSFSLTAAYARRYRFLTGITLPHCVVDLQADIPANDVVLLASAANLVASEELHPALVDLLLQAATEVHGGGGLFEAPRQFPSAQLLAFPLSDEAKRFYSSGPSFLQRYLPFWVATFVDRTKVMLLPLLALLYPLFRILPPVYRWRIRSRIYRLYRELTQLELEAREVGGGAPPGDLARRLDQIEDEAVRLRVPQAYSDLLYGLRLHIELVRKELLRSDHHVAPPSSGRISAS